MLASVKSFVIAFTVAILIFGITAYATYPYINNDLFKFEKSEQTTDETGQTETSPPEQIEQTEAEGNEDSPLEINGKSFTLLIVVSDYQPDIFDDYRADLKDNASLSDYAENDRHYSADTVLLMRADKDSGSYIFSAIPSNTLIDYAKRQVTIGALYEEGGIDILRQAVTAVTGLAIDYHIETRFDLLKNSLDLIGGIEFNVPERMYAVYEEERIIAPGQPNSPIEGFDQDGNPIVILPGSPYTIDLQSGKQHLNGESAVQMLRYSGYSDGTQGKANTAVEFFKAVVSKYFNAEDIEMIRSALNMITGSSSGSTDLTVDIFDENVDILTSYSQFDEVTLTLSGGTKDIGAETYFINDVQKTYDLFKPYKS